MSLPDKVRIVEVGARDGLQNLRVLEAIQRAARSGQTCTVA